MKIMKDKVYLVCSGPRDYKLLTLKNLQCIKKVDVIFNDRLANKNYLRQVKKAVNLYILINY